MKQFKTILILGFILMLSSFAFGTDFTENNQLWVTLNNVTESEALRDLSGNSKNLTNFGATYDASSESYQFIGDGKFLAANTEDAKWQGGNDYSISGWMNLNSLSPSQWYVLGGANDAESETSLYLIYYNTGTPRFSFVRDKNNIGGLPADYISSSIVTNQWYHLTGTIDSFGGINLYVDGDLKTSTTGATGDGSGTTSDTVFIGERFDGYGDQNFKLSSISFYNKTLTPAEVAELYAEERGYNPYATPPTPPPPSTNTSVESTAVVKQTVPVDVNTPALTTVISSTYEIPDNNTDLYGVYNFNVQSNANNGIYCEIQIDGVTGANVTRTNTNGVLGSISMKTPVFPQNASTYTQALLCSKIGAGKVTVSNAIGIGHILIDENMRTIPHESLNIADTVTSGTSYTKIGSLNFTVSNTSLLDEKEKHLVLEWAGNYNNLGASEVLNTYINVSGNVCSYYPRTVDISGIASVGGDCLLKNVTTNQTYEIEFFASGVNAEYDIDIAAKEFILNPAEIAGGTGALVGLNFTGDLDTELVTVNGGNIDHALANVFQKQAYSILTDEDTTVTMYITLNNSVDLRTVDFTRDFTAGDIGVMIGHDVFEDVPQDNYTLSVYANCGSPTATCELVGGAGIGYVTDVTTTLFEGFRVYVNDTWDNEVLLNYSTVDGVTFSTTTGNLSYFTTEDLVNFTLTSYNGNGYISKEFVNYNTSNDLYTTLAQTEVNITYETVYSAERVDSFSVVTGNGTFSTTNGSVLISPKYGTYNWDITAAGYYTVSDVEFDIVNETQSITAYNASRSQLTVTLTDLVTTNPISTYTVNLTSLDYDYTAQLSTTGGTLTFTGLVEGDFNLYVDAPGYALETQNVTVNTSGNSVDVGIYTTNSINMNFYDEESKALLSGTNITVELISDVISYNYSTNTGNLYVDLISPTGYKLRYAAPGYDTRYYYFELTNRSSTSIDLYLLNSSSSDIITVSVIDENAQKVPDALVKVLKFDVPTSKYILQQSLFTDPDGEVQFTVEFNAEFYYFVVEYPVGTQVGETSPSLIFKDTLLIQINTGEEAGQGWTEKAGVSSTINFFRDTNEFVFKYNDGENTATQGCLYVYNNKYNSSSLVSSDCSSGPVNTVTVSVPGENGSYYYAKGYVTFSGSDVLVAEKQVVIPIGSVFDYTALFLVAIMVLAFAMTAIKTGPAAVVVLPVIALAFARMSGILSNYLTWGVIGSLLAVSIVLSFMIKRRGL